MTYPCMCVHYWTSVASDLPLAASSIDVALHTACIQEYPIMSRPQEECKAAACMRGYLERTTKVDGQSPSINSCCCSSVAARSPV